MFSVYYWYVPAADSLSCLEDSADEAKVRVLISIESNTLSERELQFQLSQIRFLTRTYRLANTGWAMGGQVRGCESVSTKLNTSKGKNSKTCPVDILAICECLRRREHTTAI